MDIEKYGKTYNYNGFDKNFFSFCSFTAFYLIPIEKIQITQIKRIINLITNYTQGIYCIHPIIISYSIKIFHTKRNFKGCIIVYILSYLVSFLGKKICCNTKLKFLFI